MITDELRKQLADYLTLLINGGSIGGSGTISAGSAKVGLGGNSTSPMALDIDVDSGASPTIRAEKSNENVIQIFVEQVGSSITGQVIREMGIFDSAGNMLDRISFTGVGPFSSTETLQIYLTLEVE
jgi:hypothetical protein